MAVKAEHGHCLLEMKLLQTKEHFIPKQQLSAAYTGDTICSAKVFQCNQLLWLRQKKKVDNVNSAPEYCIYTKANEVILCYCVEITTTTKNIYI